MTRGRVTREVDWRFAPNAPESKVPTVHVPKTSFFAQRGLPGSGARVCRWIFERSAFSIPWAFQPIVADLCLPAEDWRTHGHQRVPVPAPLPAACAAANDHLPQTPTDPKTPVHPAKRRF